MVDGKSDRNFNQEEADGMVDLFNKGTHFNEMLDGVEKTAALAGSS